MPTCHNMQSLSRLNLLLSWVLILPSGITDQQPRLSASIYLTSGEMVCSVCFLWRKVIKQLVFTSDSAKASHIYPVCKQSWPDQPQSKPALHLSNPRGQGIRRTLQNTSASSALWPSPHLGWCRTLQCIHHWWVTIMMPGTRDPTSKLQTACL